MKYTNHTPGRRAGLLACRPMRALAAGILSLASSAFATTPDYTLQVLHYYGESGLLGIQTAPIMGAMIDRMDNDYANTIVIGEGDSFIPGPWLVGGADPSLNAISSIGSTALGRPDIAIMNAFGTTASALGNHEFDLGSPVLQGAVFPSGAWVGAQFPFITANLDFAADSSLKSRADTTIGGTGGAIAGLEVTDIKAKIAPYAIKTLSGQKIGFIGATTWELLSKSSPNGTIPKDDANAATSDLQEVAAYLQGAVDALQALGVNKIVLVDQLDDLQRNKDLAGLVSGIDVMVAGGGHERMGDATDTAVPFPGHDATFIADAYPISTVGLDGKPVLIVTTDTEYSYLGRLVVDFDAAGDIILPNLSTALNGAYASNEATLQAVYGTADSAATIIASSSIGTQVKAITDAINAVVVVKDSTVYGFTNVYLEGDRVFGRTQEVNLGDITADANLAKAKAALGLGSTSAVFSLKNGGGLRASVGSVLPDGTKVAPFANLITGKPAGGISQLDIENALRFDNKLMVCDMPSTALLSVLNFAAGLSSGPTQQSGGYAQVGNIRFSYDSARPTGQKVRTAVLVNDLGQIVSVVVNNGALTPTAPAIIKCVGLNFTLNGGDSYPIKSNTAITNYRYILTDGTLSAPVSRTLDFTAEATITGLGLTPAQVLGEQQAFADFLVANHPNVGSAFNVAETPVALDVRIQQLAQNGNADTVNTGPAYTSNVAVGNASVVEGNSDTVTVTLPITHTVNAAGNTAEFSVNYAITGTATSGTDYAPVANGTLTFGPGGGVQNLTFTVNGDTAVESNETIIVTLSGLVNTVGTTTITTAGTATITNDDTIPLVYPPSNAVTSTVKGSVALTGAEIPAFDPASKRAFASSALGVQVVDLTDPAAPTFHSLIEPATLGIAGLTSNDLSSVAVRKANGAQPAVLAAAVINIPKTANGHVVFLDPATGALLGSVQVGAVPDNIVFTPDGTKLLVANEAEIDGTAADVVADTTMGTVSIIDISGGFAAPTVTTANFTAFDSQVVALKAAGVRIFNNGTADAAPSVDFEPEYIAIAPDGLTAMVTLQEANAVATLDIATATFTSVVALGKKDFAPLRVDFSDRDGPGAVALINPLVGQPVFGLYMPDAIASYSAGGNTYYVMANEGDDRNDFLTPDESTTVGATTGYTLDPTVFPNAAALKNQASLGRLTVSNAPGLRGDTDNDGDVDEILSYGGRSFSIRNAAGALVFDSGDMLDLIVTSQHFANFDDGRSDNKGVEPEGVTIATLGGRTYAFVGLERARMTLMFDITDPGAVSYTTSFTRSGDQNPEGLIVVPAADSPNGKPLLITTNETSNTLTVFEIQSPGNAAPVVSVPASPLVVVASGATTVTFSATATDTEDGALTADISHASGSTFPLGDTTVSASATDSFGAKTTESFVVRVVEPAVAQAMGWSFAGLSDGLSVQVKFTKGLLGTGSLIIDGVAYKGGLKFSATGLAAGSWFTKGGSIPVSFALSLDGNGGVIMTGTIAGRTVVMDRAEFRTTNPAPAGTVGRYTFIIQGSSLAGAPVLPGGSGYGIMEVLADGSVLVKGKLADNTAYTASSRITLGGGVPVLAALYPSGATRGWWSSDMTLDLAAANDLTGAIDWHKPAQASGLYPDAADFTGNLIGSYYTPGVGLPAPLTATVATLTVPIGATTYTGTGTPSAPSPIVGKFKISGANVAQRCTLYATTGIITGGGTGLRGFNAVILQKQVLILGYGIDSASPSTGEAAITQ